MITLFAASLKVCGLSHSEAADYLSVRLDTVKSWSAGRNSVPDGVWDQMRELYSMQIEAAEHAIGLIDESGADFVSPNTDGPRKKDWPSDGAHMAALAHVALSVDLPIRNSSN